MNQVISAKQHLKTDKEEIKKISLSAKAILPSV